MATVSLLLRSVSKQTAAQTGSRVGWGPPGASRKGQFWGWANMRMPGRFTNGMDLHGATMRRFIELLRSLVIIQREILHFCVIYCGARLLNIQHFSAHNSNCISSVWHGGVMFRSVHLDK